MKRMAYKFKSAQVLEVLAFQIIQLKFTHLKIN